MSSLIERGRNASWCTTTFRIRLYRPRASAGSWAPALPAIGRERTGLSRLLSAIVLLAGLVERDLDLPDAPVMPDIAALGSLTDADPTALSTRSGKAASCSHRSRIQGAPGTSCGPGRPSSSNSGCDCIVSCRGRAGLVVAARPDASSTSQQSLIESHHGIARWTRSPVTWSFPNTAGPCEFRQGSGCCPGTP